MSAVILALRLGEVKVTYLACSYPLNGEQTKGKSPLSLWSGLFPNKRSPQGGALLRG